MTRLKWCVVGALLAAIVSLSAQQAGPIIIPAPFSGGGSFSSAVSGPDGTCVAPTYGFASDPGTGMILGAPDQLTFCAAAAGMGSWSAANLTTPSSLYIGTGQTSRLIGGTNRIDLESGDSLNLVSGVVSVGGVPATPLNNSYFSTGVAFASLATPTNGTFIYCSDCTLASPCAGAGTGALAKRLNGVWVCN